MTKFLISTLFIAFSLFSFQGIANEGNSSDPNDPRNQYVDIIKEIQSELSGDTLGILILQKELEKMLKSSIRK